ncbi:related to human corticosteroid 11-beta-dehydrogenase [Cephalotrichum gorgonifer]|uniref:Related to human corticosteroid 11-beta-dehydrogenase n=1 Tax=Cephalotrichum gorgonifer TaxID=2041049 RepID=A0AAE8MTI2_9PEZI|nr:related to human corticosteroid 11-beta-dehydrogenase [Cephalotrichum gorgonifer]
MSKVVIVTGASRGIGLAIATSLLKSSHRVVLTARSEDDLAKVKASYPGLVEYVAGDLTEPEVAKKVTDLAVKAFGQLDGVVVNHGVLEPITRIANTNIEDWKRHYDVNVFSGLGLLKEAIPALRKSKGCVVWVSSGAATGFYTAWGAYGSSKAAAHSITGHLAAEEPDITSISISPGRIDTDMQRLIRESADEMNPDQRRTFTEAFEKGEILKPETIADAYARFVVGPDRSLTGKFLRITAPELASFRD